MLALGQPFPDFSLPGSDGQTHGLSNYAGQWLVVYFYPKDNTSGCSLEAQNFAALFSSFSQDKTVVLGVSPDSIKSHCNFAAKFNLPFVLLSDPEHSLLQTAGVWQKKKLYGREYMGVERTTALVGPDGQIRGLWNKVKVNGHAEEVYNSLKALKKQKP